MIARLKAATIAVCATALNGVAIAQTAPGADTPALPAPNPAAPASAQAGFANVPPMLSAADAETLHRGVAAAKAGDLSGAEGAQAALLNPVARQMMLWAIVDTMPDRLPFAQLDEARVALAAWPHRAARQMAAERQLEAANLGPQKTIDWFAGAQPLTPEGAMALAAAYQALGRTGDAQTLIRQFWRERSFEADAQRAMLARFGALLTVDDHIRRADTLLYGSQGPAARDMIALLPPDQQVLANARMALRAGGGDADAQYAAVPPALAHDPGLAVERARWLVQRGDGILALPLLTDFPANPGQDAASRIWSLRRQLVNVALQSGDDQSALRAAANAGLKPGTDAADAAFLSGWISLTRLHDPRTADAYFAQLEKIGASPITLARGAYWRGRALEAEGQAAAAQTEYRLGGRFVTTFYGQLAAARAGQTELVLPHDPAPTAADRARFQGNELVQAAQVAASAGLQNLFDLFVIASVDSMADAEECALLVDLARNSGRQDLSMRAVRLAAQRGFILPERGYPVLTPPASASVEAPMVLGIVRQESGFDPGVRSGAGARGMMQLMPATARVIARRAGMGFEVSRLDDANYNMQLGTTFLGSLVEEFDGSYVMAAAAYNAGPNRPPQWTAACGDPRASSTDPVDYIECIPIAETRNYVMRVMEGAEVYRARLAGGRAPLALPADLKRGGFGAGVQVAAAPAPTIDSLLEGSLGAAGDAEEAVVASTPVPNPPEPTPARRPDPPEHERGRHGKGREAHAHERSGSSGKAHASGHGRKKHRADD